MEVEMQERFSPGAVQRAVLLQHSDDPAIEPGQLLVRVFVEASDEPGLAAWQSAHQGGIDAIRRELSLRLPAARLENYLNSRVHHRLAEKDWRGYLRFIAECRDDRNGPVVPIVDARRNYCAGLR
jgi:hypothetical protein